MKLGAQLKKELTNKLPEMELAAKRPNIPSSRQLLAES
jgi:hypothetical protein